MDCKKLVALLVDYVDGELDEAERQRLEEHLGACSPCDEFLSAYKGAGAVCRQALQEKMPPALKSRLSDFLRQRLQSDRP